MLQLFLDPINGNINSFLPINIDISNFASTVLKDALKNTLYNTDGTLKFCGGGRFICNTENSVIKASIVLKGTPSIVYLDFSTIATINTTRVIQNAGFSCPENCKMTGLIINIKTEIIDIPASAAIAPNVFSISDGQVNLLKQMLTFACLGKPYCEVGNIKVEAVVIDKSKNPYAKDVHKQKKYVTIGTATNINSPDVTISRNNFKINVLKNINSLLPNTGVAGNPLQLGTIQADCYTKNVDAQRDAIIQNYPDPTTASVLLYRQTKDIPYVPYPL